MQLASMYVAKYMYHSLIDVYQYNCYVYVTSQLLAISFKRADYKSLDDYA